MIPCQRALFDMPREIVFLNCATQGPMPLTARDAGTRAAARKATPWVMTERDFFDDPERVRALFARILGADAEGVALVPSASYGIETAARNLPLGAGGRVLTLAEQFPSNVYPWRRKARDMGAEVVQVDISQAKDPTDPVLDALREGVEIAALPNLLWTTGARLDLPRIGARCREIGCALVLDLTQSAGAMETDLAAIRPDFAVAASYKWLLGPYATGCLYAASHRRDGAPLEANWVTRAGAEDFSRLIAYRDGYAPGARRYDMGERAQFATLPALIASLTQVLDWGVAQIEATLRAKTTQLADMAREIGAPPACPARAPHYLTLRLPPSAPDDLPRRLAARGVWTARRGAHLRVTPHLYNDETDFSAFIAALRAELGG